jgi:hypothetical protein
MIASSMPPPRALGERFPEQARHELLQNISEATACIFIERNGGSKLGLALGELKFFFLRILKKK